MSIYSLMQQTYLPVIYQVY